MDRIIDLVMQANGRKHSGYPHQVDYTDVLVYPDGLAETELIGFLSLTVPSCLAFLIDLRLALYPNLGNTALLILSDLKHIETDRGVPMIWRLGDTHIDITQDQMTLTMVPIHGGTVTAIGSKLEYFVGNVSGIDTHPAEMVPPHMTEYLASIPRWDSEIELLYSNRLPLTAP